MRFKNRKYFSTYSSMTSVAVSGLIVGIDTEGLGAGEA
jgi:hypothetical protein